LATDRQTDASGSLIKTWRYYYFM